MRTWDTATTPVMPHHPEVLCSVAEGRAILVFLPGGESLQEHRVHEHTWMVVSSGEVEIRDAEGAVTAGGPGMLAHLRAGEPREVRAVTDARVLLLLTPWPGEGHPSQRARANPELVADALR